MARNLDPKPGRWILPLVIVGMVAFTYFFVQALEGSSEVEPVTTTSRPTTTTTEPESSGTTLTPEVASYFETIDGASGQMTAFQTELATVNSGFDARPRTIEFVEADGRLETVVASMQVLADSLAALVPPPAAAADHAILAAAAGDAFQAASEVLAGMRSTDTGDIRRAALSSFDAAVASFNTALEAVRIALGA